MVRAEAQSCKTSAPSSRCCACFKTLHFARGIRGHQVRATYQVRVSIRSQGLVSLVSVLVARVKSV